eukprot:4463924-Amphidinium_carterae.1
MLPNVDAQNGDPLAPIDAFHQWVVLRAGQQMTATTVTIHEQAHLSAKANKAPQPTQHCQENLHDKQDSRTATQVSKVTSVGLCTVLSRRDPSYKNSRKPHRGDMVLYVFETTQATQPRTLYIVINAKCCQ